MRVVVCVMGLVCVLFHGSVFSVLFPEYVYRWWLMCWRSE